MAGGDTRFQVFARLYSVDTHVGITLKVDLARDDPQIDSLGALFRGADWHEREAWEMYGFDFDGHPGLRHLYLPTRVRRPPAAQGLPAAGPAWSSPGRDWSTSSPCRASPNGEGGDAAEEG